MIKDIESIGLKYSGGNPEKGFYHFTHKNNGIQLRIDPPHIKGKNAFEKPHIHIYDKAGNSLNSKLEVVDYRSPDAHIQLRNIVDILMEPKP